MHQNNYTEPSKHASKRVGTEETDWTSQALFGTLHNHKPRKESKALPAAAAGGGGTAEPEAEGAVERLAGGR